MSEEKQYTLTEYVFRDIRFGNEYPKFANNEDFKQLKTEDPVTSVKNYHDLLVGNYKGRQHAERWSIALNSYKEYECFKSDKYFIEGGYLYYHIGDNKRVKISADTLTGPSEIINPIPKDVLSNNKELKAALNEFCSVAYTVGNVCPVMMNPGGRKGEPGGVDTCWYKLANHIKKNIEYDSIKEIPQHFNNVSRIYNNLNVRHLLSYNPKQKKQTEPPYYYALFGVFPERLSGKEIINNLMLKDYYDDKYNLIIDETPQKFVAKGVDKYIDFLRLVTTLIVKRGIRIYYKNELPEYLDLNETAENLISGLQKPAFN